MSAKACRDRFGGAWDGGGREIHGLVSLDSRTLKVELLRRDGWLCTLFEDGAAVSTARHERAVDAVKAALQQLEH